jgi:small-conductance mechanosensitive channel
MHETLIQFAENQKALFTTLVILSIIIAGYIIHGILFLIAKQLSKGIENSFFHVIKGKLKHASLLMIMLILANIILSLFQDDQSISNGLKHFFTILLILSFAWLAIQATNVIRLVVLRRYDTSTTDNLQARKINTQFKVFGRILVTLIVFIAISAILMTFDSIKQIGVSLLASAGIAGIIIGLAAQKSLGLILAGIQIAITQPIRLDDVVIVEGEWGWIEEITLTYVVVRIWDKRRLVVPITYFIEKPFQNWTRSSADILGTVFIYADYTLPVEPLREELNRLVKDNPDWDGLVANIQVTDATAACVEYRVLVSAPDSPTAWRLRVYLREKLIAFMQQHYPGSLPKTRVELNQITAGAKRNDLS